MATWSEHAHILANNGPIGMLGGVSALTFDTSSELLWAGTSMGQVVSHYGPELSRYTSYPAHGTPARPGPAKGILVDARHVYSVGEGGIKCANRRGLGKWSMLTSQCAPGLSLASMCASPLAASSDLVVGGSSQSAAATRELDADSDVVLAVSNSTGSVIRRAPSEAPILQLRKSGRFICAAAINGHIQLRDPRSLAIEHRLHAHPGGLIDMQADGNLVYSVGWTVRQGHPVPEPLIKVHDLRALRPLVPLPFSVPGGPALLAIHPKLSSTVIVSAPQGQFQIVDVGNPGEGRFYQVNSASYITSLAISPSADYLAFGEADGSVRLWSSSTDTSSIRFNPFSSAAVEMPDIAEPPPFVNWTTETPLSSVGMPYYSEQLLSYFDYEQYTTDASPLFNPPSKIDPAVISSMRTVDFVGYAPLPRHLRGRRNTITGRGPGGIRASAMHRPEDRKKVGIPLFRSEREKELSKKAAAAANGGGGADKGGSVKKAKDTASGGLAGAGGGGSRDDARRGDGEAGDGDDAEDSSDEDSSDETSSLHQVGAAQGSVPAYYRLKTIQYSRFGIEDFDFGYYNKTPYSGLETHIQNSYANSYLQALHYLMPFRTVAKAHLLQSCTRESCLLCEAGFLFRMLEDAKGANCQATNFLKAFGNSHRAATLGLMDKEDSPAGDAGYCNLVQSLNRFVLDSAAVESQSASSRGAASASPNAGGGSTGTSTSAGSTGGSVGSSAAAAPSNGGRGVRRGGGVVGGPGGPRSPGLGPSVEGGGGAGPGSSTAASAARPIVSKMFSVNSTTKTSCVHCGRETHRNSASHVVDLVYPRKGLSNEPAPPSDFASILRASLLRETQSRAACRGCQFTALFRSRRILPSNAELPRTLSVNAAVHTAEQLGCWLEGHASDYSGGPSAATGLGLGGSGGPGFNNARRGLPTGPRTHPHSHAHPHHPHPHPHQQTGHAPGAGHRRPFLPPRVAIDVRGDEVRTRSIYDDRDLESAKATMGAGLAVYKLRSMVVQVQAGKESPHLCAIVRVPEAERAAAAATASASAAGTAGTSGAAASSGAASAPQSPAISSAAAGGGGGKGVGGAPPTPQGKPGKASKQSLGPWYLFNDFLVRNISEEEALRFPASSWKIPSVLLWEREDVEPLQLTQLTDGRTQMDPSILSEDSNISWNRDPARIRHTPLSPDELPQPGTLVAIDAEFVALNQEELEIRSDGTRSVIRPTRLSLARVSVLRGQGPREGEAFIDDYISTQEEVVDYLTKFSGIQPGDLDPKTSRYTLVPLKAAYKKLRLLVDAGCVFIGHGLQKDFRIINIHVPPSQVIDTVNLFHSALHWRKLSLRFLSWFLLKIDIQNGGANPPAETTSDVAKASGGAGTAAIEDGHDSIEDALAALRLFRMYEIFKRDGRLTDVMEDLYDHGRRLNWKPPGAAGK
ncbi:related to PAN2 - component of Pab1p-stimulated poly(A) ribonuclease [Pseudozyma flocculosa]|uniref:PAN2-PAN3 deadenylation complex catalytic subunit PAN2 n=1 Tax=Pseudozyma flocculosa TaxID=84751 RepID=A0A5C3EVM9_9BASI|nr:related to PAN2 - component of Pab1p-stimulated poly(A) ribonuclease [Pseudozyma flocculosa]